MNKLNSQEKIIKNIYNTYLLDIIEIYNIKFPH